MRQTGGREAEDLMSDTIVGVWRLRSFVMEAVDTKERSQPFGPVPRGTLILHDSGHMAALLAPREGNATASPSDQAAATPKLIAYSGRYRLEPPDRLVTSVDVASFEAWIGTDQVRTYALDGDRLDLFTPVGRMPSPAGQGVAVIGILSWRRDA